MIVHVGLGKTGTTSLQRVVFPELMRLGLISAFNDRETMVALAKHLRQGSAAPVIPDYDVPSAPAAISFESLAGWNPAHWSERAELTANIFPRSACILITFRQPEDYIRGIYQQIVRGGNVAPPSRIILKDEAYRRASPFARTNLCEVFNVDRLDYHALVEGFAARFAKVIVVPMSRLPELGFLREICDIGEGQLSELQRQFAVSRRHNPSYSSFGMALTQRREDLLAALGLKTLGSHDHFLYDHVDPDSLPRWRRGIRRALRWTSFVAMLDRLGAGRCPYQLPPEVPRGRHFEENCAFIAELESEEMGYRVVRSQNQAQASEQV